MAEEPLEGSPPRGWRSFWPTLTPYQTTIAVSVALFLLTFGIYYLSGPGATPFKQPVLLADAMLHGRLHIVNGEALRGYLEFAPYEGKYFQVEPPMSALIVLPGVLIYGVGFNQTLASVIVGAFTAPSVFALARGFLRRISDQIWIALLFVFGTVYWWTAANGAVWHFSHTIAVLFLFLAIYQTVVAKQPLLAGACLGAAFLARGPVILSLPFFIIMFSDKWLRPRGVVETSLLRQIDMRPLLQFAVGIAPFAVFVMAYNYLAFDTPLPAAHNYYFEQEYFDPGQPGGANLVHGVFDIRYVPRHLPSLLANLPVFQTEAPYVVPFANGIAIWASTPAFILAFFVGIKRRPQLLKAHALLVVFALAVLASTAEGLPFPQFNPPNSLEYFPFLVLLGSSIALAWGDKMAIACWAAIFPIAFLILNYCISAGWASFTDRFALDYYPFIILLGIRAIGDELRWYHKALIVAAIIVNLWGILWVYQLDPHQTFGLDWAPW